MRIAFSIESMSNSGGMERVLSVVAGMLSERHTVTIVTAIQGSRPFFFAISKTVMCYDLGIDVNRRDCFFKKEYRKRLERFLAHEDFDVVVSMGGVDQFFLYKIKDCSKKIIWHHFAFDFYQRLSSSQTLVGKAKSYIQTLRRIYLSRQYDKIIVLSKSDEKIWKRFSNKIVQIYNPLTIEDCGKSNLCNKRAIAVGRLDYLKGFDLLICVWKRVVEKHPDWTIDIYGEGELRNCLQQQIDDSGMHEKVILRGRSDNMPEEYISHSFIVCCSRVEGLGLVLIEGALCGLPIISFDCPSGPREIVADGENGYLIKKVGDINAMTEKICLLIEDEDLRYQLGRNANTSISKFKKNTIAAQWHKLLESLRK